MIERTALIVAVLLLAACGTSVAPAPQPSDAISATSTTAPTNAPAPSRGCRSLPPEWSGLLPRQPCGFLRQVYEQGIGQPRLREQTPLSSRTGYFVTMPPGNGLAGARFLILSLLSFLFLGLEALNALLVRSLPQRPRSQTTTTSGRTAGGEVRRWRGSAKDAATFTSLQVAFVNRWLAPWPNYR
jgi:hypothetical protein